MKNFLGSPIKTKKGDRQIIRVKTRFAFSAVLAVAVFLSAGLLLFAPSTHAQSPSRRTFSSADDALQAFVSAAVAKNRSALASLFGPDYDQLLSGDDVEDAKDLNEFASAVGESAALQKAGDFEYTVTIGKDNWPTPIPLVRDNGRWFFDTKAGLDEVMNRRVGENEFSAITTCRAYAVAQWEYYTEGDWDHDGVAEYAQKLISSPGGHNGLYWETAEDDKPSPLGKFIAAAQAEGYGPEASNDENTGKGGSDKDAPQIDRSPYHGYYFKILTRQGPYAPGGKYSYVINGNMIAGFALIAYPAQYGSSGVMTFIVNQQGVVYQKDLGLKTAAIAKAMKIYKPDPSWQKTQ